MDDDRTIALEDLIANLADAMSAMSLADDAALTVYGVTTVNSAKRCSQVQRIRRIQEELQRLAEDVDTR